QLPQPRNIASMHAQGYELAPVFSRHCREADIKALDRHDDCTQSLTFNSCHAQRRFSSYLHCS
ncbi:MAG: hypothetical protein ACK53L_33310, partial [Pirellulaceae bacterium]